MALPLRDNSLPLQSSSLLSKASMRGVQSRRFSIPVLNGIPKYLTGIFFSLHPITFKMKFFVVLIFPKNINELLWKLILNSDHASYDKSIHFIIITSLGSSLPKMRVSSAYCKLVNTVVGESCRLVINPALSVFLIILSSPSVTKTNRSRYNGSLCHKLLLQIISFHGSPFTRAYTLA